MTLVRTLVAGVALAATLAGAGRAAVSPTPASGSAIQFTPQGSVKRVRQATARFPQVMVALGDPRAPADPFTIDCGKPGASRWVDSRTWAYDFAQDLPAGVRCRFTLRDGVHALDGTALAPGQVFTFDTGGPTIRDTAPYEGARTIEEDQAFILELDADVDEASIPDHVGFEVAGIAERVAARVVSRDEHDAILKTAPNYAHEPHVVVRAAQTFPNGARVTLVWGAGVATKTGIATTIDQRMAFQARPAFTVSFSCLREQRAAACNPVGEMRIDFSAPVARLAAEAVTLTATDGTPRPHGKGDPDANLVTSVSFPGPFPENASFRIALPSDLRDESARVPVNAARYPLTVTTGELPPLAKFNARFGIVESKAGATLPVTLRNLEPEARARVHALGAAPATVGSVYRITPDHEADILPWLRKVGTAKREESIFGPPAKPAKPPKTAKEGKAEPTPAPAPTAAPQSVKTFTLPKPGGERAFEVVGIPFEAPGLYIVELESARLGAALLAKPRPMYVPTAALVTNLAVHFKWGAEQSLVWVTTLDEAKPVAGAAVTIRDCKGKVVREGTTDADGLARIAGLPALRALPTCYASGLPEVDPFDGSQTTALRELYDGLLVTARLGDDVSFVHSSWDDGIEPWRFQLPDVDEGGGAAAHTILDRPLFRAGETVHMKHVFRTKRLRGFGTAAANELPTTLSIVHVGSDEHFEQPLTFDALGVGESTWQIPPEAKLGYYEVHFLSAAAAKARTESGAASGEGGEEELDSSYANTGDWIAASFRVEQFRVPLMKAVVQPPAAPLVQATSVPVDLAVQYLAGGAAGGLPVVVRAQSAAAHARHARGPRGLHARQRRGRGGHGAARRVRRRAPRRARTPKIHQRDARRSTPPGRRARPSPICKPATTRDVAPRRARVPRPERRGADRRRRRVPLWPASGSSRIEADRAGRRSRDASARGSASSTSPGSRSPARRCTVDAFSAQDLLAPQARRRRLLRLRERRGDEASRHRLRGEDRRARLLPLRGHAAGVTGNVDARGLDHATTPAGARRAHDDVWVAGDRTTGGSAAPTATASTCSPRSALRAGRDGAVPGAHAVPRGDGAGHGRARGRDRRTRRAPRRATSR